MFSVPGGYCQDTLLSPDGKRVLHLAGEAATPSCAICTGRRYWVFMASSWVGFVGSSRVRMPSHTHLSLDILIWATVLAFLWVLTSVRPEHRERIARYLCCDDDN
ncbi:hypothetical protein PR202_gb19275 [Eleusine coracana subsp. coracana]|uniref:Uncharacterized protein n=1 Tax=Eleusine coracana subsp. coracana TaxID=191504 RepID=A0AAV5F5J7_ELECO|nr:hypothetical protein PR202_gb19275 [Eleusine coracana subsp. coracana]